MKKCFLLLVVVFSFNSSFSQTNSFPATGNVGVGTATPVFKLHVDGGAVYVSRSPNNDYLLFDHSSVNTWRTRITTDNTSSYVIGNDLGGLFNTKVLVLTQNGNVGIGTVTPTEKLSVNGKIRAQEIKVETAGWPDYVFAKDYKLPSLQETEQHIKDKGHLPGIPSAEEVKANGIDLGEMNAKLLKKIEELTLHLIEKEKELNAQKQLLAEQNGALVKQQRQIDLIEQKLK
jgi:hypothetical protein